MEMNFALFLKSLNCITFIIIHLVNFVIVYLFYLSSTVSKSKIVIDTLSVAWYDTHVLTKCQFKSHNVEELKCVK